MDASHWSWGPAWNQLRTDVNILAWLFAEKKWQDRGLEIVEDYHGKVRTGFTIEGSSPQLQ
jgi:hypothetical protein